MNLFQMTISGAIFIIFVVVIRSVAINRLPKKTFIILWNIAIVRLLLPVSFPWPIANKGITGLGIVENSIANFTTEILTGHHSEIGNTATQSLKSNISPKAIPFIIWIVGAILLAGYFLLSYLRCHREFQTSLPVQSIMKFKRKSIFTVVLALTFVLIGTMIAFATSTPDSQGETNFSSSFNTDLDSSNFSDTIWTEGISFIDLAPGKNMTRSEKIIISPNEVFRYSITYSRPSLVLEFGLKSSDGTEYSKTITGGDDHGVIENVPAGTYELFVRNSGDYSEYPAYKDGTLSYSTTGCINFLLEVSAKNEIDIDDLVKPAAGNKLEFLN